MPTNSWKTGESYLDWGDLPEDEDDEDNTEKRRANMKNIWVDSKIKKQKFSKEVTDKITWGLINPLMSVDAHEAYLGAYSDTEFFAYRYMKVHKIWPTMLRLRFINSEKFIVDLFKNCDVPNTAYYKTYEDQRGDYKINLGVFAVSTGENQLYMYIDSDEINIYYDPSYEKNPDSVLYTLISLIKGAVEPKVKKNKIYVVYQGTNGFEKTGFDVKKINVNLNENYNDGFEEISKEIVDGLNDKKKTNLVILRGSPGTGKTTYIRYLTHKLKKNIIFISPDMVNHITDPSFIPFLIKNSDAVLIIEDGEPAIGKRDISGRTGAVSNILNLTDGLLSDCLNISIVVTLNTDNKDIDPALERRGRLLKHYTFEKLSVKKSKALLLKNGRGDIDVKEPMTLADIYYHGTENDGGQTERKRIGFGN